MDDKKNRQSWLSAGLQALAEDGPEGLRIMPIAQKMGVTKGSFYWHFKNLEDYQSAVMEEWEQVHTQRVMEIVDQENIDVGSKLAKLFTGGPPHLFTLGRAIRAWSMSNEQVREVQQRVDRKRVDYVAKLLTDIGWPPEQAPVIARWNYCAFIGHAAIGAPEMSEAEIRTVVQLLKPPGKS
ncbi:TetR family transcriptional regulator [Massilia sp. CCM 8695]|uniref:TetR family transcriptional regulator n=1 Tax=Massilia frigida TaxID=2609281 RepID=A0ABX0NBE5_9BURK|nr:TetR/AcrR family transcriptional regulator [Massilia frigida]NHZ80159.1 TetR family transcriptional regulator [Massilia frigida]